MKVGISLILLAGGWFAAMVAGVGIEQDRHLNATRASFVVSIALLLMSWGLLL